MLLVPYPRACPFCPASTLSCSSNLMVSWPHSEVCRASAWVEFSHKTTCLLVKITLNLKDLEFSGGNLLVRVEIPVCLLFKDTLQFQADCELLS